MTMTGLEKYMADVSNAQMDLEFLKTRLKRRKWDKRRSVAIFGLTFAFTSSILFVGAAVRHPVMVAAMAISIIASLFIGFGLLGDILDNKEILSIEQDIENAERKLSLAKQAETDFLLKGPPYA